MVVRQTKEAPVGRGIVNKSFDRAASGGHGIRHFEWVQTMGHEPDTLAVGEAGGTDTVFTLMVG